MNSGKDIIKYLGEEAIADAVGVAISRVRRASHEPFLPASWFDALERLAGRPLDRAAFAFKGRH